MKLSVVIPCYNHGSYLEDALGSLPSKDELDYEVIIVDDGSEDPFTREKINELKGRGYAILSHPNHGLGYSRNAGIASAAGEYILPLDADNKMITGGIQKAIALLDQGRADIVYGKPSFFGEDIAERKFVPKPFDGDALFIGNYIDACAVFRKSVWTQLGGYDEHMPFQGNEDWEFWLRAHVQGFRFHYLDEYCYDYRIIAGSMFGLIMNDKKKDENHRYITMKHHQAHIEAFARNYTYSKIYQTDQLRPLRSVLKYLSYLVK